MYTCLTLPIRSASFPRWIQRCVALTLAWLLMALSILPARAVDHTPDLPDLEPFLDDVILAQLEELGIPGAAVAVIAKGELRLVKGYGYADREENRPVDGERTLFRTGSVGKLVTWTAVMQLVEAGRLDLHADVNTYLDFTIPATFAQPITLFHLMTHTPGFEDVGESLFVLLPEQMMPLRQYLIDLQPARVFPPGTVQAYSNYGTALAGYIVERVSGEPFTDYVERHIFAPLEMEQSTLRQPVSAPLSDHLAVGYGSGQTAMMRGGFVFMPPYPAGAMSASAGDMGRFLIAHSQEGRYGERAILQPDTVHAMQRRHFAPDPRLDGMGYGWMMQRVNGHEVIFHRGSTFQFNAGIYLLPGEDVGLYIVYNGLGGQDAPAQLWQRFMDRYYPGPGVEKLIPASDAQRISTYMGEYHLARADFTGPAKVFRLLESAQVTASDGYLQLMVEGQSQRFVEVEPGLFRHEDRESYLAFHTDGNGTQWLSMDGQPAFLNFTANSAFQVPWYATLSVSALLLLLTLLIFILSALVWAFGALRRRGDRRSPLSVRVSRWLAVGFVLLLILFLGGLASIVGDIDPVYGVPRIFFGAPTNVDIVLLLPWGMAVLAGALLVATILIWRDGMRRGAIALWSRIHHSLLAVLAVSVVGWLAYWNLLA